MSRPWRLGSIVRFSLRGLSSRPRSSASIVASLAVLAAGLFMFEAVSWQSASNELDTAIRNGSRVWVVEDNAGELPARTCDSMRRLDGVTSAFAVGEASERVEANGHMPVPMSWVTTGVSGYFGIESDTQVVVGADLARLVESNSGRIGSIDHRQVSSVVVPVRFEGRQGFMSASVMVTASLEQARYCVAEFSFDNPALVRSELQQTFSRRSGAAVDIRRLNSDFLSYNTAQDQRSRRSSRFGWVLGAPLASAIVLFLLRLRRNDLGVMMLLGADRTEICMALGLQVAATIWTGVAVAAVIVAGSAPVLGLSSQSLVLGSAQVLASMSIATLIGLAASWRGAGSMLAGDVFKSTE